ncbi:MAG: hypothetical protein CMO82_11860 [Winogradskyella sp.]|nr:hypothetical protein [Winogradskyella sp.]|tara:strand:- start:2475 stop:3326 length:852 start_codon:yes stop_codon:yes gene_type:complete
MKFFSFLKAITLALVYFISFPLLLFLPKHTAYVFVLTTGRSGSGTLSNIFKNSPQVNSFHEPYPILNNNFSLNERLQKSWIFFQYMFIKFPKILWTRLNGKTIYLETNHLFLKSFCYLALKTFKSRIKIIHLVRPAHSVAKSMYDIGKIPGDSFGNRWYLDPYDKSNYINFENIFQQINDQEAKKYKDLYKCIWYWFETEERIKLFKNKYQGDVLMLKTNQLNDINLLVNNINSVFNLNVTVEVENKKIDKNLKKDEKSNNIDIEVVIHKKELFLSAYNHVYK